MRGLIAETKNAVCDNPLIGEKTPTLSQSLEAAKGKADAIVDELAKISAVAGCYAAWNKLRDEMESHYKDTPRQHLPLSQQKEFRAIKNLVIQEAENLRRNVFTFADADVAEECTDVLPESNDYDAVLGYCQVVEMRDADDVTQAEKRKALQ